MVTYVFMLKEMASYSILQCIYEVDGCLSLIHPSMKAMATYLGGVGHPSAYLARDGHLCTHCEGDDIPFHLSCLIYLSIHLPPMYLWGGWLPIIHFSINESDGHLSSRSWPPTYSSSRRYYLRIHFGGDDIPFPFIIFIYLSIHFPTNASMRWMAA